MSVDLTTDTPIINLAYPSKPYIHRQALSDLSSLLSTHEPSPSTVASTLAVVLAGAAILTNLVSPIKKPLSAVIKGN